MGISIKTNPDECQQQNKMTEKILRLCINMQIINIHIINIDIDMWYNF